MTVDKVIYSKEALKFIKNSDAKLKNIIKEQIEKLKKYPPKGDIKNMQGYSDGTKRLRFGKYRILFRYDEDGNLLILQIINIGPRGDIYK